MDDSGRMFRKDRKSSNKESMKDELLEIDEHLDWIDAYIRHNCDLHKTCDKCPMLYRRGGFLSQYCLWYEFLSCINKIEDNKK